MIFPRQHRWRCHLCDDRGPWGSETDAMAGFERHYRARHAKTSGK